MRVVIVRPRQRPYVADIKPNLKEYQETVGGYIETLPLEGNAILVCDEEGKLKDRPYNRFYWQDGHIVDVIAGPFFIVGVENCNFCDLTDEQCEYFKEKFRIPDFTKGG